MKPPPEPDEWKADDFDDEDVEEEQPDEHSGEVDWLGVLNGLSAHYELGDPLLPLSWSWPFFCAQWARMTDVLAKRKVNEQKREERHRDTAMQAELERRLAAGGVD